MSGPAGPAGSLEPREITAPASQFVFQGTQGVSGQPGSRRTVYGAGIVSYTTSAGTFAVQQDAVEIHRIIKR